MAANRPANRPDAPQSATGPGRRDHGQVEDRLEHLLSDPIVQLLMERDGVERDVLLRVARTVRGRTRSGDGGTSSSGE